MPRLNASNLPLPAVDVRRNMLGLWRNAPDALLYLHENDLDAYNAVVEAGGFTNTDANADAARYMQVRSLINTDRAHFHTAPALAWEATHVQNGLYAHGAHNFRVRTARHGGANVLGRRIVQVGRGDSWTSFAFITRSGGLRLWMSFRADAMEPYVQAAEALFTGNALFASVPTCWLCNSDAAQGTPSGLCNGHIRSIPDPVADAAALVENDSEDEDDSYVSSYTPRARRTRTRPEVALVPVVNAIRSPLNADFWQ